MAGCAFVLPAQADLTNRWSFNEPTGNATAGTAMIDSISGAVASVEGNGSTFTGTGLTITGTTNGNQTAAAISGYVNLPNGIFSSKTNLTVEIWAAPLSYKANARMFDFGRSSGGSGGGAAGEIIDSGTAPGNQAASDAVYVNFCLNSIDTQRMKAWLNGTQMVQNDTTLLTTSGAMHHYVFTFQDGVGAFGSAGGRMTWYRNGAPVTTADVNFRLQNIEDVNNWLGRSNFTNDLLSHANYNEVRLYDHVLTSPEINANLVAGPDSIVTPQTVAPPVADNLWSFTTQAQSSTPSGTTFTDSVGGQIATLRGNGGSLTGGAVVLPGTTTGNQTASAISAYLDLPNGIVTSSPSVSFEAWATPLSSKAWQRLFDFGRCVTTRGAGAAPGEILDSATAPGVTAGYDNLSLTFNNAGNINSQQLEGQYDGNPMQFSFTSAITAPGTQYHYVLVVEDGIGTYGAAGCQARWYRNGALQNSADFPFRLNGMEDVNNWIGRSMYSGDSNSNLSLNEFRIYRRVISQPEIQASYTSGPDPTVGPPEPPVPQPIPARRWTFDAAAGDAPSGTTFADEGTGEIATVLGHGATLTGTSLVLPGTTNGNQTEANISGYLNLANGLVSSHDSLTFEAWITPLSSKLWQRLFDFGNSSVTSGPGAAAGEIIDGTTAPGGTAASDTIFLSLNNNNSLGNQRLMGKFNGGADLIADTDLSGSTSANTEYHYVMSVQEGGGTYGSSGSQAKWYRNGVLQGTVDLNYRLAEIDDVNNWIGRSQYTGDSNSNFAINELRLYDRALTASEILTSHGNGPDASFGPPVVVNDGATIHPDQKVLVDVLANDSAAPLSSTLEISSPPSTGSAVVKDGKILYTHTGTSAAPVTFIYRVANTGGLTADGTVTISFAASLRLTNEALAMPSAPPTNTWQLVDALPGLTFTRPVCLTPVPGDANQLYVCQQGGVIRRVADVTSLTPTTNVFLDLTTLGVGFNMGPFLAGQPENGLLGLAFHPDYANNGYFYVAYTVSLGGNYFQRVSRFSRDSNSPAIADPSNEQVLLHIDDFGLNHNGGDLHFGPFDGYLYYGTGDGENSTAGQAVSQTIDEDFYAGIFRIDVDKRPGSLPPNPHPSIPTTGGVAHFSVPPDNPFIHTSLGGEWNGTYLGVNYSGSLGSVRTEFWATGIRHAWRMSFDPVTGDLWEGDVGQSTYEEVNKIVKGGNYGWAYREGANNFNGILGNPPAGFTSVDPIYDYLHTGVAGGDAQFKGNSVVGGYVYRGSRYPSLVGRYVFSDSVSGHVWEMNTANGTVSRLTGLPGAYGVISAQGVDPFNKDLLFCAYLTGKIMRLTTGSTVIDGFPTTLGATGLFSDLTDLSPAPGLLPYQPNLTFWSDFAVKRRWFTIPDPVSKMTWSKDGNWTYPTGTVWVKHFDLELSRDNPATKKRIETRVLVKTDTGTYGVSYRWNEAQTEANLVEDAGTEFDVAIDDHGTPHTQRWQIPGRSSCLTCHTPQGGHALSFNTRQLNLDNTINGYSGNQLTLLSQNDFLSNTPDPVATLERHVRPDETQYPLEQRARSYFAVNCSYCHQAGGSVGGFWDGRGHLTLEQTNLINGAALSNGGNPLNKYVVPGDPGHSIVLSRMAGTNGFGRMPPLGTTEVDPANIQLITDWITGARGLYDEWRTGYFTALDPNGDKTADPDGDGVSNYEEYLRGSSPTSGSGSWQASIANGSLQFLRKSSRFYSIQTSDSLGQWQSWPIPELESTYKSTDELIQIPLPVDPDGKQFFRFNVTEP